jgi:hypothetical protein
VQLAPDSQDDDLAAAGVHHCAVSTQELCGDRHDGRSVHAA